MIDQLPIQGDCLLRFSVPRRIVPYVRAPHGARFRSDVKRYHTEQKRLAIEIRKSAIRSVPLGKAIDQPVFIGVAVFVQPVKSGKRKGMTPANIGDWDNYFKAVADCLVYFGILAADHAGVVIGPGTVILPDEWLCGQGQVNSGVYLRSNLASDIAPDVSTAVTVWGCGDQ